jgi:hypothetical protein
MTTNWTNSTWIDNLDTYTVVSSLYGPGATGYWYLTGLSSLASRTMIPEKRISGSIDSDFIALLTFPTVAAGHLITQVHPYPAHEIEQTDIEDIPTLL